MVNLEEDNIIIDNFIYDFLFSGLDANQKEEKLKSLIKKMYKTSSDNKSILYYSYQLMILFQIIFQNNESFRKRRNILSFKLHFILSNEKLFSFNSSQFANLYSDLFFIKHF